MEEVDYLPKTDWRLKPKVQYGKAILEFYKDLDDFASIWRKHFIETMDPKFMPEHWDINRRVYSERT